MKRLCYQSCRGRGRSCETRLRSKRAFQVWDRVLYHIDEAMSWESVRNLKTMGKCLVLVRNLLGQEGVPEIVGEHLEVVNELMSETLQALKEGEFK